MVLKVLGSTSKGNCYLLEASDEVLIIEAGVSLIDIKKTLHFQIHKAVGAIVSHLHRDHSKFIKDLTGSGINVLALPSVFESHKLNNCFCINIAPLKGYKIGGFTVYTLPVAHDVPCLGFVITHKEMGKLLFVTDTMMLEYKIPGLNHIMIEANYSDTILQDNILSGAVPASMKQRLLQSHMELSTTKEYLLSNDISKVHEIILLHLSDNNSNSEVFRETISKATGKPIYVANKGLELDLYNYAEKEDRLF